MNNRQLWKVFSINNKEFYNKEIYSYTLNGTFKGEEEATKKLLAVEYNCKVDDIIVSIELR